MSPSAPTPAVPSSMNEVLEIADRNSAPTSAAGLNIVDFSELAGLDDLLDLLHIFIEARLKADREDLSGSPSAARHVSTASSRVTENGFSRSTFTPCFSAQTGRRGVPTVVRADGNRVELLLFEHFLVRSVNVDALDAEFLEESLRLAGDDVAAGDEFRCHSDFYTRPC